MHEIAITLKDAVLVATRSDGAALESACDNGGDLFSAAELLAASLGSCVAASLRTVLLRHGMNGNDLRVTLRALGKTLERGFALDIALPPVDESLRLRCRRAALACPVRQALNIPVELHWQDN